MAISPNGKKVVSASDDETLKVWELKSGKLRHTLEGHGGKVTAVAIAPDSTTAVSASRDMTLKVWELKSGKLRHTLEGHMDSVTSVAISPSGKIAVSASRDQTLEVWDLKSGEVLQYLVYAVSNNATFEYRWFLGQRPHAPPYGPVL